MIINTGDISLILIGILILFLERQFDRIYKELKKLQDSYDDENLNKREIDELQSLKKEVKELF